MKLSDDVHNYYEHLVLERLDQLNLDVQNDSEAMADLCCLVLNQLPPRYIRHEVDMAFYLSQHEHQQMLIKVRDAVDKAVRLINDNKNSELR